MYKKIVTSLILFFYSFSIFASTIFPESVYVEMTLKGISIFADRKYRFVDDTFIVRNPKEKTQTVYQYSADSQFIYLDRVISADSEIGTYDTDEILYDLNDHTLYLYFPDGSELSLVEQDYKNNIVNLVSTAALAVGTIGGVASKAAYNAHVAKKTAELTATLGLSANQTVQAAGTDMQFTTDSLGRPSRATGTVTLGSSARNSNITRKVGNIENRSDVDGGHLIGDSLGGPSEPYNLVEMTRTLNRGAYAQHEKNLKNLVQEGHDVKVDVRPIYAGSKIMPSEIVYNYTVDGEQFSRTFLNE